MSGKSKRRAWGEWMACEIRWLAMGRPTEAVTKILRARYDDTMPSLFKMGESPIMHVIPRDTSFDGGHK